MSFTKFEHWGEHHMALRQWNSFIRTMAKTFPPLGLILLLFGAIGATSERAVALDDTYLLCKGSIAVDSRVGEFTEFIVRLPRGASARVSAEGGGAAPSSSWPGSTRSSK